jgi:hypothetical protein
MQTGLKRRPVYDQPAVIMLYLLRLQRLAGVLLDLIVRWLQRLKNTRHRPASIMSDLLRLPDELLDLIASCDVLDAADM